MAKQAHGYARGKPATMRDDVCCISGELLENDREKS